SRNRHATGQTKRPAATASMTREIFWTAAALGEFDEIVEYIRAQDPLTARRVAARIDERVASLSARQSTRRTTGPRAGHERARCQPVHRRLRTDRRADRRPDCPARAAPLATLLRRPSIAVLAEPAS